MPVYWLDANVFIQAKNGPYAFDIAPTFWTWIENSAKAGTIRTSIRVYREIRDGKDQLANWIQTIKSSGLFCDADAAVTRRFSDIAVFVQKRYAPSHSAVFLAKADPWVIAHAWEGKGIVVTHETLVDGSAKAVKIPNVCAEFGIQCVAVWEALRRLKLKL